VEQHPRAVLEVQEVAAQDQMVLVTGQRDRLTQVAVAVGRTHLTLLELEALVVPV
jgi:hypothetical protein